MLCFHLGLLFLVRNSLFDTYFHLTQNMLSHILTLQEKEGSQCARKTQNLVHWNVFFPCKAEDIFMLEWMSVQLFPWEYSSPAPIALVSVSSVQNLSLGQIWLSSPISQNNTLEALLLQTWWSTCFIFSALPAHFTQAKMGKKADMALKRKGCSTFSTYY